MPLESTTGPLKGVGIPLPYAAPSVLLKEHSRKAPTCPGSTGSMSLPQGSRVPSNGGPLGETKWPEADAKKKKKTHIEKTLSRFYKTLSGQHKPYRRPGAARGGRFCSDEYCCLRPGMQSFANSPHLALVRSGSRNRFCSVPATEAGRVGLFFFFFKGLF